MNDTYARADHVAVWLGLPSICEIDRSRFPDPVTLKTYQVEDFDWWDNMEDLPSTPQNPPLSYTDIKGRDLASKKWIMDWDCLTEFFYNANA